MQYQIKNVDHMDQLARRQHLQLFPHMRLRNVWPETDRKAEKEQSAGWHRVYYYAVSATGLASIMPSAAPMILGRTRFSRLGAGISTKWATHMAELQKQIAK